MPAQLLDHVLASHHRRWDKVVPTQHLLCTESAAQQFALTLNLRTLASSIHAAMWLMSAHPYVHRPTRTSHLNFLCPTRVAPSSMESNRGSSSSAGVKRRCLSAGPTPEELAIALSCLLVGAPQLP
jgi:hypothetical protein